MIKQIVIENYKSIESLNIESGKEDIICLIGKNGSGKSNIFKAIKYFFDHINKPYSEDQIIDNSNPYIQKCKISITFNLKILKEKSKYNFGLSQRFSEIESYIESVTGINKLLFTSKSYDIKLEMVQYKDGFIKWSIKNKKVCETIKFLFPIYYIDTRLLDIFTWEQLWQTISDLSAAMPQKSEKQCREIIDSTFYEIYGEKYKTSKDRIEKVFKDNNISLDQYHFKSKYKNAFAMRFGGEQFLVDNLPLSYFSDGSNSYHYLVLLVSLIPQISDISCKYPIILLDEPEIGLHSKYITDFTNSISKNINKNTFMLISTHSPKLLSDLIMLEKDFHLYNIINSNSHSHLRKMNTAWLTESRHKPTVKETECFFYDYLVYVEGETEIQLFTHKKIRELFPKLGKIHFYSFDANHERLKTVNSKNLNLGVPYKLLVDMDQILNYSKKKNTFSFASVDLNPLYNTQKSNKQLFRYYKPQNVDNNAIFEKIKELLKNSFPGNDKNYINDSKFSLLMSQVQYFCLLNNTIVNWSTIEGELITYENIEKFIEYLETLKIKHKKQHDFIVNQINDSREKAVLILCEYNGKTEFFEKGNTIDYTANKKIQSQVNSKVSGWVSSWINYYFEKHLEPLESEMEKRLLFKADFPGLFNTLQQLENMVK